MKRQGLLSNMHQSSVEQTSVCCLKVGSLLGLGAMVLCIAFGSPWYLCAAALALAFWSWRKRSQSIAWGRQFGFVDYVHANHN